MSDDIITPQEQAKTELAAELARHDTNPTRILQLSNRIAALDQDRVRFTADAAVIRRLGRELVGRQETALAELIKNAYDADAGSVSVRFLLDGDTLLSIEVTDDGNGMARAELIDGFMRLASDLKVREPRSPRFQRRRAGRKGIGRFASERLGDILVLTTRARGAHRALRFTIDWRVFEQGIALNEIETSIAEIEWDAPHGTRLEIIEPRDRWNQARIDRVFKSVSALLQPFPALVSIAQDSDDPGFWVAFYRRDNVQERDVTAADIETEIFKHAFAYVEADIDEAGLVTWSLSSKRYALPVMWVPFRSGDHDVPPLAHARNAKLRAYYFINRSDLYPSLTYGTVRAQLENNGGVRLYRNGFRVLPYGEPEDDWLQLDELESRRIYRNASLANRNFLGAVEIDDAEGAIFEETSSREGLIENLAFEELREIFSAVLVNAARRITAERIRTSGRSSLRPIRTTSTEETIAAARQAAARLAAQALGAERPSGTLESDRLDPGTSGATVTLHETSQNLDQIVAGLDAAERLAQERAMLRTLASLGLTVAEFTHEFRHQSQFIELTVDQMMRLAPEGPLAEKCASLVKRVDTARDFSSYFGEMVSERARRKRAPVDLYLLARDFGDGVKPLLASPPVRFTVVPPADYDIYTSPMFQAEWSSILMNFLTNSLKAIRRARAAGQILVRTGRVDKDQVYLEFCDNGDGIPFENRARVFDAFFSTSGAPPAGATGYRHELGSGLGLKIVNDIVEAAAGEIIIADPPEGYATCIRVTVPAATPDEINE